MTIANAPASVVDAAAKKAARRKRFEDVFPLLKQELLEYLDQCKMPQDARDWYDRVCEQGRRGAIPSLVILIRGRDLFCMIAST